MDILFTYFVQLTSQFPYNYFRTTKTRREEVEVHAFLNR